MSCHPNLVGYWKFDESGGGVAIDSVGNNDLSLLNGANFSTGVVGNGLYTGYARNLSPVGLPSGNVPKTIMGWYKTTLSGRRVIGGFGYNSSGQTFQIGMWDTAYYVYGWASDWDTGYTAVRDGNWHQVAVTYDGATTRFYLDGTERASTTSRNWNTNPQKVIIGAEIDENGFELTDGIDEFAIFDVALTSTEISNHYNIILQGKSYCDFQSGIVAATLDSGSTIDVSGGEVEVVSTLDAVAILALSSVSGDSNFNTEDKWHAVTVYYKHDSGQMAKIIHEKVGGNWTGRFFFPANVNAGVWRNSRVVIIDGAGDKRFVSREELGDVGDLTIVV